VPYPDLATQASATYFAGTGSDVMAYYYGRGDAAYSEELGMYVNGVLSSAGYIFPSQDTSAETAIDLGFAPVGSSVFFADQVFGLNPVTLVTSSQGHPQYQGSPLYTLFSNPALNMLDNTNHAYATAFSGAGSIPAGTYIGFEDLLNNYSGPYPLNWQADFNYTDEQFVVTGTKRVPYVRILQQVGFHPQEGPYNCGDAAVQMITDSDAVGLQGPAVIAQSVIRNYISTHNTDGWSPGTGPLALAGALNHYDPAHTYTAHAISDQDCADRTLAYDIDTSGVPGAAQIKAGSHWVIVYGVNTSVQPAVTGPSAGFAFNGFYVNDPLFGTKYTTSTTGYGFLGKNTYVSKTLWDSDFTAGNQPGDQYNGKYVFVTANNVECLANGTGSGIGSATPVADITSAISAATIALTGNFELADDLSFIGGGFGDLGACEVTRRDGTLEWLVPYYQSGSTDPSAAVFINAATGALDEACWDEGILAGMSLSEFTDYVSTEQSAAFNDNPAPEPSSLLLLSLVATRLMTANRRRVVNRSAGQGRIAGRRVEDPKPFLN
jgi:hypothetical protein